MRPRAELVPVRARRAGTKPTRLSPAAVAVIFALAFGAGARAQDRACSQLQAAGSMAPGTSDITATQGTKAIVYSEVRHHVAGFYDDRSLDVAIAVEQVCVRYIRYRVRLQLPSGGYQSIAVIGPPGGFQPEVRDVTGDDVRNDLILTPALFPWLPLFLVNDGHDHFAVANSGAPGSLTSGDNVTRGGADVQAGAALTTCGLATGNHTKRGLFVPPLKETLSVSLSRRVASRLGRTPGSGRAPPLFTGI